MNAQSLLETIRNIEAQIADAAKLAKERGEWDVLSELSQAQQNAWRAGLRTKEAEAELMPQF